MNRSTFSLISCSACLRTSASSHVRHSAIRLSRVRCSSANRFCFARVVSVFWISFTLSSVISCCWFITFCFLGYVHDSTWMAATLISTGVIDSSDALRAAPIRLYAHHLRGGIPISTRFSGKPTRRLASVWSFIRPAMRGKPRPRLLSPTSFRKMLALSPFSTYKYG